MHGVQRKWAEACAPAHRNVLSKRGLQRLNVGSLQTLRPADHLELNGLAFVQRTIAIRLNCGEMDENVLASLALDESEPLAGVKPLHCSLFFHRLIPLIQKAI